MAIAVKKKSRHKCKRFLHRFDFKVQKPMYVRIEVEYSRRCAKCGKWQDMSFAAPGMESIFGGGI